MPLLPLNLPPGMYKNGTPYSRKGRYTDGNLIRWHDGAARPIGGWIRRTDSSEDDLDSLVATPADEAVRDIFSWRDNGQGQNIVFGSNKAVYHLGGLGTVTDITYAGFTPNNANKDPTAPIGYGSGRYGGGAYGASTGASGSDTSPPDRWYFDNFGEILLFGVRSNGGVYELDLSGLTTSQVSNSPASVRDLCVTAERQVFAVGTDGEPRRVRASDVEDRTDWTPAAANQSIDRVLAGTGALLRCIPILGQVLILGENDAHRAVYIGPPYIYSIRLAGEGCGPLAPEAVASIDQFAVWWGQRNFWIYDGGVKVLPCDVIDFLQTDVDQAQISKITAFTNTDFSEVWWLYQSNSSTTTEVDSYVVWNYLERTWNTGRIDRTAGIDKGVTTTPIMVDHDGFIYNHENEGVMPDGTCFIETGALDLGNGEKNMAIRYIYPDTEGTEGISYELITRRVPDGTEVTHGPYTYMSEHPVPTTGALGRSVKLKATLTDPNSEYGRHRLEYAPIGSGHR